VASQHCFWIATASEPVGQQSMTTLGKDGFGMELDAFNGKIPVLDGHHDT
jgi:hypothetical protein